MTSPAVIDVNLSSLVWLGEIWTAWNNQKHFYWGPWPSNSQQGGPAPHAPDLKGVCTNMGRSPPAHSKVIRPHATEKQNTTWVCTVMGLSLTAHSKVDRTSWLSMSTSEVSTYECISLHVRHPSTWNRPNLVQHKLWIYSYFVSSNMCKEANICLRVLA